MYVIKNLENVYKFYFIVTSADRQEYFLMQVLCIAPEEM